MKCCINPSIYQSKLNHVSLKTLKPRLDPPRRDAPPQSSVAPIQKPSHPSIHPSMHLSIYLSIYLSMAGVRQYSGRARALTMWSNTHTHSKKKKKVTLSSLPSSLVNYWIMSVSVGAADTSSNHIQLLLLHQLYKPYISGRHSSITGHLCIVIKEAGWKWGKQFVKDDPFSSSTAILK